MLTPCPVIKDIYDLVSSVHLKSIDAYVDSFSRNQNIPSWTVRQWVAILSTLEEFNSHFPNQNFACNKHFLVL
jgi:hypothetical protein